ncbi:MAG: glycerate kinase type-2 family protein [Candidatus Hodarchaeales archaeon]
MNSVFHSSLQATLSENRLKKVVNYVDQALMHALDSLDPYNLIKNQIKLSGSKIIIQNEFQFDLTNYSGVYLFGAGKASIWLASALIPLIQEKLKSGVLNVLPSQADHNIPQIKLFGASHPIPNEISQNGALSQINLLQSLKSTDLAIFLFTGGASSLFVDPRPPLTLHDIQTTNNILLHAGLNIHRFNAIRKHLSNVKGGWTLQHTKAEILGLYVSDVIGNQMTHIGSGPTVPDLTTFKECKTFMTDAQVWDIIPSRVQKFLDQGIEGKIPETPKIIPKHHNVTNILLGSNEIALKQIKKTLEENQIPTIILSTMFQGEASEIGQFIAKYQQFPYIGSPRALIYGGESTVTFKTNNKIKRNPIGGRNQELVLSWLLEIGKHIIQEQTSPQILLVSMGTDGIDGNSPNAGGIGIPNLWNISQEQINLWIKGLQNHESSTALAQNSLITTGPTKTNVADIIIALNY